MKKFFYNTGVKQTNKQTNKNHWGRKNLSYSDSKVIHENYYKVNYIKKSKDKNGKKLTHIRKRASLYKEV